LSAGSSTGSGNMFGFFGFFGFLLEFGSYTGAYVKSSCGKGTPLKYGLSYEPDLEAVRESCSSLCPFN